ncbi:Glucose-fructose oxidoreductase domain-containing protein 1 [Trichoplax sp. H2]|nr:Glucose-fructose oxidoreductase domain-containing protein 1 [Trichoplax sp. H2]|eukprot:RDD44173.1 Glucose-fructose oxidoreductase domain-containing protein 1 [Trichoplax sp. H2]
MIGYFKRNRPCLKKEMLPRVGIFVTEWSADVLIPLFRQVGFSVTALWSRTPQVAKKIADNFNIPYYTSKLDELLLRKDVDLLFINCPPFLHAEIAVKALGIGKHVVCQLPSGLTTEDSEKMLDAARYYPSLLSLIQHEARFLPAYVRMKELITSGYCGHLLLGDIRIHTGSLVTNHYNWLCNTKMGGGSLNLIGSSVIDIVSYLTNSKATEVLGHSHTFVEHQGNIQGKSMNYRDQKYRKLSEHQRSTII